MPRIKPRHSFDVVDDEGCSVCSVGIDADGDVTVTRFETLALVFKDPAEARKVGEALIQAADHAAQRSE